MIIKINKCYNNKTGNKQKKKQKLDAQAILHEQGQREQTGQPLNYRVAQREMFFAAPAFSPQYKIADNGYVVIEFYGLTAIGAMGGRVYN